MFMSARRAGASDGTAGAVGGREAEPAAAAAQSGSPPRCRAISRRFIAT